MHLAAGQFPDHPGIDRAGQKLTGLRAGSRAVDMVQQPGDLCPGEIGVEQQAGDLGHTSLAPRRAQAFASRLGAPVLPDDRPVDRGAGLAVPDHHRLALVGDADGGDLAHVARGLLHRLAQHRHRGREDRLRIVLDPAVRRIELLQRAPGFGERRTLRVEQDRPSAGGPLIEREDQRTGHVTSFPEMVWLRLNMFSSASGNFAALSQTYRMEGQA